MKLKAFGGIAAALLAVGLTTAQLHQISLGLTDGGLWGAPRYATADLPTCDTTQVGAMVYDTTAGGCLVCDGSAWGNCFGTFLDLVSAYWDLGDQFYGATANYESKVADNSLDLTPTNDPLRAPYANRLPAAQFVDGNSEYLSVADPWTSGDIDFSVGCWVYLDDLTGDLPIASKDDGAQQEWRLYFDDNTTDAWVFEIFDGAGGSRGTVSSSEVPAATTWTLVVGAHDATNNEVGVSVNGAAYTTAATSGVAVDTDDPFELGRMTAATYMDGRLSQCFFITEELSAADLGDLYNNGVPVPSRLFASRVATAAEGLWDLSELSGNRSDFTANAVTLTDNATVLHGAGLAPKAYEAADFEASASESLTRADETQLRLGDTDWSVVAWVRHESLPASALAVSKWASGAEEWYLRTASGQGQLVVYNSAGSAVCDKSSGVVNVAGEWAMLTAFHSATSNTCGVADGATTFVSGATSGALNSGEGAAFAIGGVVTNYFDGLIGPVAIWSGTVLTEAQKDKLYAGGQAFSCSTIPPDLPTPTLCWDLDEPSGTRSASIGDADLTDNNTVLSAEGIADIPGGVTLRAADFELSASEYLSRASESQLQAGANSFTLAAWFRAETVGTDATLVSKWGGTSTTSEYNLAIDSTSAATFGIRVDGGAAKTATHPTPLAVEQWYLATGVWNTTADTPSIGLNGGSYTTASPATGDPPASSAEFRIGRLVTGADRFWDGEIGPVYWFQGTALTEAQSTLLYNSGDALNCSAVESVVGVAPTVCWNLDEASGTRSAEVGTADLADNNTVLATGGLVRGGTGHASFPSNEDGSARYHVIADFDGTLDMAADWSISAWGYVRNDAKDKYLFGNVKTNDQNGWMFFNTSEAVVGKWGATQNTYGTLVSDQWAHIVMAHDSATGKGKMWVNGAALADVSSITITSTAAADFQVGNRGEGGSGITNFTDAVDEVLVAGTVLTNTQVACLYNSGLGRSYADLLAGVCD